MHWFSKAPQPARTGRSKKRKEATDFMAFSRGCHNTANSLYTMGPIGPIEFYAGDSGGGCEGTIEGVLCSLLLSEGATQVGQEVGDVLGR